MHPKAVALHVRRVMTQDVDLSSHPFRGGGVDPIAIDSGHLSNTRGYSLQVKEVRDKEK